MTNLFIVMRQAAEQLVSELLLAAISGELGQLEFTNGDLGLSVPVEMTTKALIIRDGEVTLAALSCRFKGEAYSLGSVRMTDESDGYHLSYERSDLGASVERLGAKKDLESVKNLALATTYESSISGAILDHALVRKFKANPSPALAKEVAERQGKAVGGMIGQAILYIVDAIQRGANEDKMQRRVKEVSGLTLLEDGILAQGSGSCYYIQPTEDVTAKEGGYDPVCGFYIARVTETDGMVRPTVLGDICVHKKLVAEGYDLGLTSSLLPLVELAETDITVVKSAFHHVKDIMGLVGEAR